MYIQSINPANNEIIGQVKSTSESELNEIVRASRSAYLAWKNFSIEERIEALKPIVNELKVNKEALAELVTLEMGKPYKQSIVEVEDSIEETNYYLENAKSFLSNQIHEDNDRLVSYLIREARGVSAVISPWNYPLEISLWGIIPSLLCGNTVIFKPSELTILTGEMISRLMEKLNLPKGVFNTVYGDGAQGNLLINNDVDFIWFTGSTETGQKIYESAGRKFIKTLMEMGGSSPAVITADYSIDDTLINDIVRKRFTNCGQVCSAVKRVYVHKDHYAEFLRLLIERVKKIRVGNPFEPECEMSCLASLEQLKKLEGQVKDAVEKGAVIETGGSRKDNEAGAYFLPTVVTKVNSNMKLMNEEVFGPVLPITEYASEEEVTRMINASSFGLSADIYCNDREKALKLAGSIDAGRILINYAKPDSVIGPFGGFKKSGMGRDHGKWGFDEMTQLKYIITEKK